ncbi:MAG: putative cap specific mRNA, partial [Streblomastix strix]
ASFASTSDQVKYVFSTGSQVSSYVQPNGLTYFNLPVIFHPIYGPHSNGDVTREANIRAFRQVIMTQKGGIGVSLVTADGGFSVDDDYNSQELKLRQLVLCQFTTALGILRQGGTFLCKIFDVYTPFTVELFYLLSTVFSSFTIIKPLQSRPANSERYILCRGFLLDQRMISETSRINKSKEKPIKRTREEEQQEDEKQDKELNNTGVLQGNQRIRRDEDEDQIQNEDQIDFEKGYEFSDESEDGEKKQKRNGTGQEPQMDKQEEGEQGKGIAIDIKKKRNQAHIQNQLQQKKLKVRGSSKNEKNKKNSDITSTQFKLDESNLELAKQKAEEYQANKMNKY